VSLVAAAACAQQPLWSIKGRPQPCIIDPVPASNCRCGENGITGHEVAASPMAAGVCAIYGNSAWAAGTDGANIVVVDVARTNRGNIAFDHGVRPHCAVFGRRTDCSTSRRRSTAQ